MAYDSVFYILLVLLVFTTSSFQKVIEIKNDPECQLNIAGGRRYEPIVTSSNYELINLVDNSSSIQINKGDTLTIGCTSGTLLNFDSSRIEATCSSDTKFIVDKEEVNLKTVKCDKLVSSTVRRTGKKCATSKTELEIGFDLGDNTFVRSILVCFDEEFETPLYSISNLTRLIFSQESSVPRISFVEDKEFYHLAQGQVDKSYTRKVQRTTINSQLGLSSTSLEVIQNNDFYFARGHLVSKADFLFANTQLATFHYVNAAPQWQTFNGKNWFYVESNVRDYATNNDLDLVVYTGTYGILTLPNVKGEEVPLYFFLAEEEKSMPIPQLFWKIVHDPVNKQGVVLIGVNNPYVEENALQKYVICPDVISEINWLTSVNQNNLTYGYIYACKVNDFKKIVTYLPKITASKLLL